jgi:hypothetical protein
MSYNVTIQLGKRRYAVAPGQIPPVGTKILVDKHFSDDGVAFEVKVVAHEWEFREAPQEDNLPGFSITIKTRKLNQ